MPRRPELSPSPQVSPESFESHIGIEEEPMEIVEEYEYRDPRGGLVCTARATYVNCSDDKPELTKKYLPEDRILEEPPRIRLLKKLELFKLGDARPVNFLEAIHIPEGVTVLVDEAFSGMHQSPYDRIYIPPLSNALRLGTFAHEIGHAQQEHDPVTMFFTESENRLLREPSGAQLVLMAKELGLEPLLPEVRVLEDMDSQHTQGIALEKQQKYTIARYLRSLQKLIIGEPIPWAANFVDFRRISELDPFTSANLLVDALIKASINGERFNQELAKVLRLAIRVVSLKEKENNLLKEIEKKWSSTDVQAIIKYPTLLAERDATTRAFLGLRSLRDDHELDLLGPFDAEGLDFSETWGDIAEKLKNGKIKLPDNWLDAALRSLDEIRERGGTDIHQDLMTALLTYSATTPAMRKMYEKCPNRKTPAMVRKELGL